MVVARAGLFDVGANEETALGDIGGAGLDARQDLGPFGRRTAEFQHADLIVLPEIGIDHLERSEEHTSELQSLMRISYAVFCLKKKNTRNEKTITHRRTLP